MVESRECKKIIKNNYKNKSSANNLLTKLLGI